MLLLMNGSQLLPGVGTGVSEFFTGVELACCHAGYSIVKFSAGPSRLNLLPGRQRYPFWFFFLAGRSGTLFGRAGLRSRCGSVVKLASFPPGFNLLLRRRTRSLFAAASLVNQNRTVVNCHTVTPLLKILRNKLVQISGVSKVCLGNCEVIHHFKALCIGVV